MEDTAIGALSRNLDSLDGDLAATTKTGNTVLLLANLHGDEHPRTASRHQRGPTALTTDEYGNPRTGQAATRYQWIVTAGKTEDGGAVGRIEPDAAGFMRARHGDDYDRPTDELWEKVKEADGEHVSTSRYPLLYVPDSWEVMSMLELLAPGVDHRTATGGGERTVWMLHPTARGPGPPRRGSSTRRRCTRVVPVGCGTSWNGSVTGSTVRAVCRCTGRGCGSVPTASSPCRAAAGR